MASISTIARLSFNDVLPTTLNTADSDSPQHSIRYLLRLVGALLFSLHCAPALAGDIARDTPAASMALAQGLYATPGPSASVSTVATPTVTASPLPSASPPLASPPEIVSAAAPSLVATAPPAKTRMSADRTIAGADFATSGTGPPQRRPPRTQIRPFPMFRRARPDPARLPSPERQTCRPARLTPTSSPALTCMPARPLRQSESRPAVPSCCLPSIW